MTGAFGRPFFFAEEQVHTTKARRHEENLQKEFLQQADVQFSHA